MGFNYTNCYLDSSPSHAKVLKVLQGRRVAHSTKSGPVYNYFFKLEPTDDALMPRVYELSEKEYSSAIPVLTSMTFEIGEGRLGVPWYRKQEVVR